jgi:FkbM family methyltransferase
LYCYIKKKLPKDKIIELRNGLIINLSNHPHDLVTIFVVFIKMDYGLVKENGTVIDVGANIGAFSLFAAKMGAQKVFAYEPNKEAFEVLELNIINNNMQHIIFPYNFALYGKENLTLKFPKESSPYNKFCDDNDNQSYELVSTTTLQYIIDINKIDFIDFLKIDCEGCEFDTFFKSPKSVFLKINKIMMEYHQGPMKELIEYLEDHGFSVIYHHPHNKIRWLSKS